jgi:hypothetical protein
MKKGELKMKIVINRCYGGFGLSKDAYEFLGKEWDGYGFASCIKRTDPKLVECVETLGSKANGNFANLKVVEIPNDVTWEIDEYDGMETIEEVHRTWC